MKRIKKSFIITTASLLAASLATTACVNSYNINKNPEPEKPAIETTYTPNGSESEFLRNIGLNDTIISSVIRKREPVKVKGLYLTAPTAADPKKLEHFIQLANRTEINTYIIDIKDNTGILSFPMDDVPLAKEARVGYHIYDPAKLVQKLHENNIYVIGRIVCFDDSMLARARPEFAIHNSDKSLYKDGLGSHWVNPYNQKAWEYMADIAVSAKKYGFDEIQFDYVRFPSDRTANVVIETYGSSKTKAETITEFLEYAKGRLGDTPVSADVFGIICGSLGDSEGLGQDLEVVGRHIDYLSPMIYPSHYALGQVINGKKFPKPDLEPYGVIYQSLTQAKARISGVPEYKATMRPYLQDFNATWIGKGNWQRYTDVQVREQIQGVYDAGYEEWILWNAACTYSEGAFEEVLSTSLR